jgi:primosomal protein N''
MSSAAAEERIAGVFDAPGQAQLTGQSLRLCHPAPAEIVDLLRRADAHIFAHAERLQPVEVLRRLAPEAVAGDVEQQPLRRHLTAARASG